MRNEQHRPLEVLQRADEHFLCCKIEVVRGFIETRKFGGYISIRAITSRVFSPPESERIFLSISCPEN